MSRILKRPMFRKGGSTNEGIMHGIVDRKGYDNGTDPFEFYKKQYEGITPPRDTSLYEMLIGGGLNLVSGAGAGQGGRRGAGAGALAAVEVGAAPVDRVVGQVHERVRDI